MANQQTTREIPEETLREAVELVQPGYGDEQVAYECDKYRALFGLTDHERAMYTNVAAALAKRDAKIEKLEGALKVYGDKENWCDMDGQFTRSITFQNDLNRHGYELAQSVLTPKTGDSTDGK